MLSELIKKGLWFGDYGVGLHGIIFKIPMALLFIILGHPSVFAATMFTISLSLVCVALFYKIVREYFIKSGYAIWPVVILAFSLHFLDMSLSFNRDIPGLLVVLIFFYLFLKKSNTWLIGLVFVLMLDAKEHMFLTIAPFYGIYLLIEFVRDIRSKNLLQNFFKLCNKFIQAYLLSIAWIVLMFTTSWVPMNMFVASIGGLTDMGQEWNMSQFSTESASKNLLDGKEIFRISKGNYFLDVLKCSGIEELSNPHKIVCGGIDLIDTLLAYTGKILYPRTFSFISIPKIIALPAIIYALSLFKDWWKKKDKKYILPIILLSNILITIIRVSHGRYLLVVAPLFALFFVLFIKNGLKNKKLFKNILIMTSVFVIAGLFFESTYVFMKIILELGLLSLFWILWYLNNYNKKLLNCMKYVFLSSLCLALLLTYLAFSYSIGQISSYRKYGYNNSIEEVVKDLPQDKKIWIEDFGSGQLIYVYMKDYFIEPEWIWKLSEWIPKKNLLKVYTEERVYSSEIINIEEFKKNIYQNNIEYIILFESLIKGGSFPNQKYIPELLSQDWLTLEEVEEFKNKKMYIFVVEK